jgi:hypothetical protein
MEALIQRLRRLLEAEANRVLPDSQLIAFLASAVKDLTIAKSIERDKWVPPYNM